MRRSFWQQVARIMVALVCAQALCAPPVARADAASAARDAFERGVAASNEARWKDARREFLISRDLVVKPSTLFNLAVADLKLGLSDEALAALDAFERLASETQHAAMLERAVTLRAEAERAQEAARPGSERARGLLEPSGLSSEARTSFAAGRDAYARGEDALALDSFVQAHRASGRDELLYDIGVVADRLREDERAVEAFERFVKVLPSLPEAELAQRHLARLRRVLAEKARAEPAQTIARSPEENRPTAPLASSSPPSLRGPYTLLGVGAALGAAAIGSAFWWIERSGAHEDRCLDDPDVCSNYDTIRREKRAAMGLTLALGASGLALLTGGGIWLRKRKHGPTLSGLDVRPLRGRGGLLLEAQLTF